MAMKIGKEAKSALIHPGDVDRFAVDVGFGAARTRARVPTLADSVLEELPGIDKPNPVSETVASLIEERCKDFKSRFSRK